MDHLPLLGDSAGPNNPVNCLVRGCAERVGGCKKAAFTLAELLITLSVIGVVAALTLPTLLTSISEKVKTHKIKVFERKLQQGTDLCMSIKDKLGIKECCPIDGAEEYDHCSSQEYWAGAVKQCGGVWNMPTMKDLAALASAIYLDGENSITIGEYDSPTYDVSKMGWETTWGWIEKSELQSLHNSSALTMLGMSINFGLWSGYETDITFARTRAFNNRYTGANDTWRGIYHSNRYGICMGE